MDKATNTYLVGKGKSLKSAKKISVGHFSFAKRRFQNVTFFIIIFWKACATNTEQKFM